MSGDTKTSLAERIIFDLKTGVAKRGEATLIVCGGSSPLGVFEALAQAPDMPWEQIHVSLVDDRLLPPDHPDSNERLVCERLLKGKAANFISLVRSRTQVCALPRPFDVVLLGMGPDGHFASLFPSMMATHPKAFDPNAMADIIEVGPHGSPAYPRVTMNLAMILEARRMILMVVGDAKQDVLTRARQGESFPVSHLLAQKKTRLDIV